MPCARAIPRSANVPRPCYPEHQGSGDLGALLLCGARDQAVTGGELTFRHVY
jgi:hypothetical protein